jgi:hypothetical protein
MTPAVASATPAAPTLLDMMRNLAHHHREHEKYYSCEPLQDALVWRRQATALRALADRWLAVTRIDAPTEQLPFLGCDDLNAEAATELAGILFMESDEVPSELDDLVAELRRQGEAGERTGSWLVTATESSWEMARGVASVPGLEDHVGGRHAIIGNTWLAAHLVRASAAFAIRAADVLEGCDLRPSVIRADLSDRRALPNLVYSVADLIDVAADRAIEASRLLRSDEGRWRTFEHRLDHVIAAMETPPRRRLRSEKLDR